VAAIQATGRDAILRGSGGTDSKLRNLLIIRQSMLIDESGAAVCILETHSNTISDKVRGLARMVQVSPTLTLVDLTIRGLSPGKYWATIRETGDISNGAISTRGIWQDSKGEASKPRGLLGTVQVDKDGIGSVFIDKPIQIWEIIGRGLVVSKQHEGEGKFEKNDEDTLVGVIARSAGVWDNDKTVCSCSGKNLWEERKEEVKKGML
jgi:copper chaperone for superoxide dismutase